MAMILLETLADTRAAGMWLAGRLAAQRIPLLLSGELGSGKTTLTRAIVSGLPGGENAEVSSPSFTIANIYPTNPPVMHCDLYRCGPELPEDIAEALEDSELLIIMEWADNLADRDLPGNRLDIGFEIHDNCRLLRLEPHGPQAEALATGFTEFWIPRHQTTPGTDNL